MNKKGQFFLIGAIVIISIIIGFVTVQNVLKKGVTPSDKVYYLQDELGFEGGKVIDYGIITSQNIDLIMRSFTQEYSQYAGEQKSLYFVFGTKNSVTVAGWQDIDVGNIDIDIGGVSSNVKISRKQYKTESHSPTDNDVKIIINKGKDQEQTRTFKLGEGQNFYFVIQQNVGDEIIVVDSETQNEK